MNGKIKAAFLIIAALLTSAAISFISVVAIAGKSDRIYPGVTVKELDLGNMSRERARQVLTDYGEVMREKTANVTFQGGSGSFRLAEVDFRLDAASTAEKAWLVGRRGNFIRQWQERREVARNGLEIPFDFTFSTDKLLAVLENITKEVRVPPRDARLVINADNTIEIVESTKGIGIDIRNATASFQKIIKEDSSVPLEVKLIEIIPSKTTEDIKNLRVNGLIADYTTRFDVGKTNRVYNIKVAASALDGLIIKPGEVFSFNEIVGPRSEEKGYKMAPTILNNEFIDSLGGGVCQVSTTLYNTLLQADVEMLERSSHSLVISYVPLGQDAAVAYGSKDLKFRNNLPAAIVIKTSVEGDRVTIKLFSDAALRKTVKINHSIIKEYPFKLVYKDDPTLPKGQQKVDQKGTKGYRVTSRITIFQNGQYIGEKSLLPSYYKPLDEIILVGTKPVASKPASGGQAGGGTGRPGDPGTTNPGPTNPDTTSPGTTGPGETNPAPGEPTGPPSAPPITELQP